jgi:asparagine synthase (glutamine-hydrolysing)
MFGLAIWDENEKKLMLARDAMGIKPLYYKETSDTIVFGSEITPILTTQNGKTEVDPEAVNMFFRYRYVPSPMTVYRGIKKLAPGTMLLVHNGRTSLKRWYRFTPKPFSPKKTLAQARDELSELYKRAIERHLISDVPVGLLLSGGVDSGLLLGLMNSYGENWPTFTVGYGEEFSDDELSDAQKTADYFGAQHSSVFITKNVFENSLEKIIGYLEEPVATSSIVPMYFVCQRAREDVKVAFIGQGPDELFGGYIRHLGIKYGGMWRSVPGCVRTPLKKIVKLLPRNESLKRGINSLDVEDRMQRYQNVFSLLPSETVDGLFQEGIITNNIGERVLEYWSELNELMRYTDELGGFQFIEIRSSLPDELLMFGDKLSMAHSLEVRVPYLDREIVEYVECLDETYKVKLNKQKVIHRKVCEEHLPGAILNRKKKGFATNVVDDWFNSSVNNRFDDYIMDSASMMYKILQPANVQKLLIDHKNGKDNNYKILFSLVLFEEWLRLFLN